jgi:tetratricopeptide (TPR) repeat protein
VTIASRLGIIALGLLLYSPALLPQSSGPPEFSIEIKKGAAKSTQADQEYFELLGTIKTDVDYQSAMPKLDAFIKDHPDYTDARYFRANTNICILNSRDFSPDIDDLKSAIAHPSSIYNVQSYSLLAKIQFAEQNYSQATELLYKTMAQDLNDADKIFNIGNVEPEKNSNFCTWNLTDLNLLINKFPNDFRVWLYRGLYYEFFTTFKEEYFAPAIENFRKAALLSPESSIPQFLIGKLYTKQSFWTKKAASSEIYRDEQIRTAIRAYSKAIQLDPKFIPAYVQRADSYLSLKQYQLAIRDYDRILALDPENDTAHSDRGIAQLESGHYMSAISDFGEAISKKEEGNAFLPELYEDRADAQVKLNEFGEAIGDYTKAIAFKLSTESILLSLKQIRGLYPEFANLSDDALCRKLHDRFWPNMEYAAFCNTLMHENGKWSIGLISTLYEKRGDAYLQSGDFRSGVADFQRIYKGIPNFADSTDRWRIIGASTDGSPYLLDVKTADFKPDSVRLWLKSSNKNVSNLIEYELQCNSRQLRTLSVTSYGSNGKMIDSSDVMSDWVAIIPESLGERLYSSSCSSNH